MRKPFMALAVCSPLLLSGVAKADFNTTYQDVVKAAGAIVLTPTLTVALPYYDFYPAGSTKLRSVEADFGYTVPYVGPNESFSYRICTTGSYC